ncbi:serine hydrolase [Blastococcus sp. MG754426]|uniref:serine hydrolase n=1 Tax=unclassified Blastococcus TaxID=2619396 RepID=UPI001EF0A649|nr:MULTISPECIES: serine hydrolase [unclassified Blastococcus]MCF6507256.1 serine hydrolase [Blastococcus sp. MG754426]MCF6511892.1 serine hydrolase [Blastococcus sp. MG754427]MCF6734143.1 serine hydrolase [Blastococcus sp. KM273129]
MSHPVARHRSAAAVLPLVTAVLTVVHLLALEGFRPGRAVAGGEPPAALVADAVEAYGAVGTLAVVVDRQQRRITEGSVRAAEARSLRWLADGAGNSPVADRAFPTASMVKLFMAEDILTRARAGSIALPATDRDLLREMIRRSDDPAASALWVRYGGGQMVRDVAERYGLGGTGPPPARIPGQWGQAVTTAQDLARFLARLPVIAHPEDAAALLGWMREATPVAADGFDQQFGLFGTLPGEPGVKQGWMCCVGGQRHLHSVAVLGSTVAVLLSEVPRSVGYDAARAALTAAGAAVAAGKTVPSHR